MNRLAALVDFGGARRLSAAHNGSFLVAVLSPIVCCSSIIRVGAESSAGGISYVQDLLSTHIAILSLVSPTVAALGSDFGVHCTDTHVCMVAGTCYLPS